MIPPRAWSADGSSWHQVVAVDVWVRPDGECRSIEHLFGPEAPVPPANTPWAEVLDWLDLRLPGWEGCLYLGTLAGFLLALLVKVVEMH